MDNHYMNVLEKLDLKEFVSNHKKEFGAPCGKLSWFWYFNKFPGLKLDNCAAESYYRVLKDPALFGGSLQLNISLAQFLINSSQEICKKNFCFSSRKTFFVIILLVLIFNSGEIHH